MKISKREIIKAIKSEPLQGGSFVTYNDDGCKVCAVGAVLRNVAKYPYTEIEDICTLRVDAPAMNATRIPYLMKIGDYVSALSSYFEDTWERVLGTDEHGCPVENPEEKYINIIRDQVIEFIENNFPDSVEFPEAVSSF